MHGRQLIGWSLFAALIMFANEVVSRHAIRAFLDQVRAIDEAARPCAAELRLGFLPKAADCSDNSTTEARLLTTSRTAPHPFDGDEAVGEARELIQVLKDRWSCARQGADTMTKCEKSVAESSISAAQRNLNVVIASLSVNEPAKRAVIKQLIAARKRAKVKRRRAARELEDEESNESVQMIRQRLEKERREAATIVATIKRHADEERRMKELLVHFRGKIKGAKKLEKRAKALIARREASKQAGGDISGDNEERFKRYVSRIMEVSRQQFAKYTKEESRLVEQGQGMCASTSAEHYSGIPKPSKDDEDARLEELLFSKAWASGSTNRTNLTRTTLTREEWNQFASTNGSRIPDFILPQPPSSDDWRKFVHTEH